MLQADVGACRTPDNQAKRFYYDEERGTCRTFIYSGCAGNQNNFVSFESCIEFCSKFFILKCTSERIFCFAQITYNVLCTILHYKCRRDQSYI